MFRQENIYFYSNLFYTRQAAHAKRVLAIAKASARPSVCLSVTPCSLAQSKRCKLVSRNFHRGLPQRHFLYDKISCRWVRGL